MRHQILFLVLIVAAFFIVSGCAQQQQQATDTGQQAQQQEQAAKQTQQKVDIPEGESYLGKSDLFVISTKQLSTKLDALAKEKYSDACLISVLGSYVSPTELGKAAIWSYKYYSKAQNKAVTFSAHTKETIGGADVFAAPLDTRVFMDESYLKCIVFSEIVDSTDAVKAVSDAASYTGGITLGENTDTNLIEYSFVSSDITKSVRVNAKTGELL